MRGLGAKAFEEMANMLSSAGGALVPVAAYLVRKIRDRTKKGQSMWGGGFQPYTERYAMRKGSGMVNLYGNMRVSHHGGNRMLESMVPLQGEGVKFNVPAGVFHVTSPRSSFISGNDVRIDLGFIDPMAKKRANWHQFGAKHIPPRPFFGFTDEEAATMAEIFGRELYQPRNTMEHMEWRVM